MSKRLGIPYVTPYRDGGWRYRRLVPEDCHTALDRKNWTRAWRAGTDLEVIAREAKQLAAQHDAMIRRARGEAEEVEVAEIEQTAKRLHREATEPSEIALAIDIFSSMGQTRLAEALAAGGKIPKKTLTLKAALKRDRKLYSADRDHRAVHYAVESFQAAVGDLDVMQISRADVSTWIAAQRDQEYAPATIRRRYGALKALVDRMARDLGSEKRSPFEHRIGGKSKPTDRLPLNKAMLDAMVSYLDRGRCSFETVAILKMMMLTGGSLSEIAGLAVSDVSLSNSIPFIHIRENDIRPLKTISRKRRVPLVGPAAKIAKEAVRVAGERDQLFTGYSATRGADSLSARLNKALRTAGIPKSRRLTTHSLRHTMSEALRSAEVHYVLQKRLLGHSATSESDKYGSPTTGLEVSQKALKKALKVLGRVDDSEYGPDERL